MTPPERPEGPEDPRIAEFVRRMHLLVVAARTLERTHYEPTTETEHARHVAAAVDAKDALLDYFRAQLAPEPPSFNAMAAEVHARNHYWWHDLVTGERIQRNKGELMMLIVSEVAEAMEGARKGLMDDKLPHRTMEEVEMADAVIRILDYCGGFGLNLDGAIQEKLAYNATRADHKPEVRLQEGGKKW